MISVNNKDEAVKRIRERFDLIYKPRIEDGRESMACLFWACCAQSVLAKSYAINSAVIAGSAQFQFRTNENDDGRSPTHFSYMFDLERALQSVAQGKFPEMHAWLVTESSQLVDVTTKYQLAQMKRILGPNVSWD